MVSLFDIEDEITGQVVAVVADDIGVIFHKLDSETHHAHIKFNDLMLSVLKNNRSWITQNPLDSKTTLEAVNQALEIQPENPLLLAIKANLYSVDFFYELNLTSLTNSHYEELVHKAVSLDSNLQIAQFNSVALNAILGRPKQCLEEARKTIALNPHRAWILAGCAWSLTMLGEYEKGVELTKRAMQLNPHYPGWYHLMFFMADYHDGQYQKAWAKVQKVQMPEVFWHHLFRAAVLGQLGRIDDVQPYLSALLEMRPDFVSRHRELMKRMVLIDEHVE